jgi:hypothetical protein
MQHWVENARKQPRSRRKLLVTLAASFLLAGTPACAQTGDPIGVILAAGDIAGCFQADRKYKEVAELIGKEVEGAKVPVAVLALGDLAYANRKDNKIVPPTYADCFEEFKATWGKYQELILPVPGNHDYSDDPTKAGVFKAYFAATLSKLAAHPDGLFYSTRFPANRPDGWLLATLNLYATGKAATEQKKWITGQLAAKEPRCVLVFAHPFINSSGHHGVKAKPKAMTLKDMVPFFKIMHDGAATVLVAGHDHDLEQFDRQDTKGKAATTGVRSFVVGTGGASLYKISDPKTHKLKKTHPRSQAFSDRARPAEACPVRGRLRVVLPSGSRRAAGGQAADRPPDQAGRVQRAPRSEVLRLTSQNGEAGSLPPPPFATRYSLAYAS